MWQDSTNTYASSSQNSYYTQSEPLQFYSQQVSQDQNGFYPGSRPSLDVPQGSIQQQGPGAASYGGNIHNTGEWWTAFGTGGFEGEPPLLEGV
jgi:protein YIPF5/7